MSNSKTLYRYEWIGKPFDWNDFWYCRRLFYVLDKETNEKILVGTKKNEVHWILGEALALNSKLNNSQFLDFCAETAPDIFRFMPIEIQTSEMQEKIAKNTTRYNMISHMNLERLLAEQGQEKVEEVCITIVKKFGNAIGYLPPDFMFPKILDVAVVCHKGALSKLKDEYRTLERCILSVSKWGTTLKSVPKELWQQKVRYQEEEIKLYELAVRVNGLTLKLLPLDLKTSLLCEKAVMSNPDAIVYVPPKYITPDFMKKLYDAKIAISSENKKYVDECLNLNEENNQKSVEQPLNLWDELLGKNPYEIPLSSLSKIINKKVLGGLSRRNIDTLGKLLKLYETPEFVTMFTRVSYTEINGTVNVLKCKLFNTDPLIDFSEKITAHFLSSKFGISSTTANIIEKSYKDKSLGYLISVVMLEEIQLPNIISMKKIPHIDCIHYGLKTRFSNGAYDEIYEKFAIIVGYYQKRQADFARPDVVDLIGEELRKIWPEIYTEDSQQICEGAEEVKESPAVPVIDEVEIAKILTEISEIKKAIGILDDRLVTLSAILAQLRQPKGIVKSYEKH